MENHKASPKGGTANVALIDLVQKGFESQPREIRSVTRFKFTVQMTYKIKSKKSDCNIV